MRENVQGKSGLFPWLNENFEKIFMVTGLLAIILFITWQVIYRYIITQFIERAGAAVWTEELSRYIFIWISYLALSAAIRKRSSIRVDILYDRLPERLQNISWIIVESLFLVLTGVIAYYIGIRGIFITAALIFFLMIPLMFPTVRASKAEYVCDPDATGRDLEKA